MSLTITPLYAGIMALMLVVLSVRVVNIRRSLRVPIGDGGSRLLLRRIRAQANFAEYVPMTILLMALAELQGVPVWIIHLIGLMLLVGRIVHSSNISRESETIAIRVVGMVFTFNAVIFAALANIGFAIWFAFGGA